MEEIKIASIKCDIVENGKDPRVDVVLRGSTDQLIALIGDAILILAKETNSSLWKIGIQCVLKARQINCKATVRTLVVGK